MAFAAALVGLFARAAFGEQQPPLTYVELKRVSVDDAQHPLITLPANPESKRYIAPKRIEPTTATELTWRAHANSPRQLPVRQAAQLDRPLVAPHVDDEVSPIPPALGSGRSALQADDLVPAPLDPLPPRGAIEELADPAPVPAAPAPAAPLKPCPQSYRDTDCCAQGELCRQVWAKTQADPVRGFPKDFLDITPLYKPDVRYQPVSDADQSRLRREGLSLSSPRIWKYADGRPVMVDAGEVVEPGADVPAGAAPLGPASVVNYDARTNIVQVKAGDGATYALPLGELTRDDQYWVKGRPWHDLAGDLVATGRLENYKWGRVHIRAADGQMVAVPLARLGADELCYVDAYWGDGIGLPPECRLAGEPQIRDFTLLTFTWTASALCHKPLYFEEVQLERYGHSAGPLAQPVISGAHFFANIAVLPYKMGIHPPTECVYALGYYRPGSCAPYMIPPVPFSLRGGLFQAGAVVGVSAILP